jgi:hypothetical protein
MRQRQPAETEGHVDVATDGVDRPVDESVKDACASPIDRQIVEPEVDARERQPRERHTAPDGVVCLNEHAEASAIPHRIQHPGGLIRTPHHG